MSPLIMEAQTVLLLQIFYGLKCVCVSCFKLFSLCVLRNFIQLLGVIAVELVYLKLGFSSVVANHQWQKKQNYRQILTL